MDRHTFLLASAAMAAASPASAQTRPSVTIGAVMNEATMSPFYAKEEGFFENAGLNATVSVMNNGAVTLSTVLSGAIDIGGSALVSLIVAFKKGAPVQLVAPAGQFNKSSPVLAIIVLKNSPIMSAKDLEGKVIAVNPVKSLPDLATDVWIDKNGGNSSRVRYLELPNSEMEAALVQGRIAAAALGEPYFSEALGTCRVLALPFSAIAPQFPTTAYFTTTTFAKAHPDIINKFAKVMQTTAIWANENQKKAGELLAAFTKLDPTVIAKESRVLYGETLSPASIQPLIDLMASRKMIDSPYPASDMVFQPGK